jgi:hypothetical protein
VRYVIKVDRYNRKVGFWRGKVKKLFVIPDPKGLKKKKKEFALGG